MTKATEINNKNMQKQLPVGIYGITAEKFSQGRTNIQVVQEMIDGGIKIVQYREKKHLKNTREMLAECEQIRVMTRANDVKFIINDHVDIALLVDADGVHVGQDDLPVTAVRRLLGPEKIIGLSTHSPQQAQQAFESEADYIGVGPIFSTQTKEDVCAPVGLDYLDFVVNNSPMPYVAIGGIKSHNINEIVKIGAQSICLVTEIVGADDIAGTVRSLHASMNR